MAKRFPFRTAIAGLTALAVVTPVITPANTTVLSAPVAHAAEAVTVAGTKSEIKIGETDTFTATVLDAQGGQVQFYLDGVAVDGPVELNGTTATKDIAPKSYTSGEFKHTVTARYIDADGYNPSQDATATFTTPVDIEKEIVVRGPDEDTFLGSKIGLTKETLAKSSLENPVIVGAGQRYWLESGEKLTSGSGRFYESGINPPVGSTYVEGTMDRLGYSSHVPTRGNDQGTTTQVLRVNGYQAPYWGTTQTGKYAGTFPKVNKEYVGQQAKRTYNETIGNNVIFQAQFVAPQAPGVYVPQYAVYKYTNALHALRRMDDAAFLVPAQKLPDPKPRPAEDKPAEAKKTTLTLTGDTARKDNEVANITATVAPAAAGTVTFYEGENKIDDVTVKDGKAVLIRTFNEGTHDIRAEFTPDDDAAFNASETTANHTLTVTKAQVAPTQITTKTTLEAPAEGKAGTPVQLKATVTNGADNQPLNAGAGQVRFIVDGVAHPNNATVQANGIATLNHTFADAGVHKVVAQYVPLNSDTAASTSDTKSITVKQDTTVELKADNTTPFVGDNVTVTATVTDNVAGKVQFTDAAGKQLNEATVSGGKATYTFAPKDNKPVEIKAKFVPSQAVSNASVSEKSVTIEPKLREAKVSVTPGQTFTSGVGSDLTARVTPADAKGKVIFENTINGQTRSREAEVVNGTAVLKDIPFETAGERDVTVKFVPAEGSPYGPDTATGKVTVVKKVEPKDPQISIEQSTGVAGEPVTITAKLKEKNVLGTVKLFAADQELTGVTYDPATGTATASHTFNAEGIYEVRAEFTPNDTENFLGSKAVSSVSVAKDAQSEAPKAKETTTEFTKLPENAVDGEPLEIKVSVTAGEEKPEGEVELYDGAKRLGAARLDNGVATFSGKAIAGNYNLTATYVPADVTKYASSSTTESKKLEVTEKEQEQPKPPATEPTATTVELKASENPKAGSPVTVTATVTDGAAGEVEFFDGPTSLGKKTIENGKASIEFTPTAEGTTTIKAVFTPTDATKHKGTEKTLDITVAKKDDDTDNQQPPVTEEATTPTVTVTASENPKAGSPVTVTAAVSEGAAGEVEFFDGNTSLGTKTVQNGTASIEFTPTAEGATTIKVVFTPADTTKFKGANGVVELIVDKADATEQPTPTVPGTFTPELKEEVKQTKLKTTEGAVLPAPSEVLANATAIPAGSVLSWTKLPTVADPNGEITVTYPGGTATVQVPFEVAEKSGSSKGSSEGSSEGSSDGKKLSTGAIVGIVFGSVTLLLGLIAGTLYNNPVFKDFMNKQFGIRF